MEISNRYIIISLLTKALPFVAGFLFAMSIMGCGVKQTSLEGPVLIEPPVMANLIQQNGFDNMEIVDIMGHKAFIKWPTATIPSTKNKWVFYAPSFLNGGTGPTPMPIQMGYYFDELAKATIVVIGMDIGESFGSPEGRRLYEAFYHYLVVSRNFEAEGCMIVQSRGGLMGYNWMMDYPGRVKCVAGIYPLTTVTDYVGISGMSPAWGVTDAWLQANLSTESPLERLDALNGVKVLHFHGDADNVVHLNFDQSFVSNLSDGSLVVVPGAGHDYDQRFFHNQGLLDFLISNLISN